MKEIVIPDHAILAVNRSKQENVSNNIIYRDKKGKWHSIDFETCASNFKIEHKSSPNNCIGERKMDKHYFILYTSGIKTKITFKNLYVSNIFCYHLLSGSKTSRFLTLQNLINETKYTTKDL